MRRKSARGAIRTTCNGEEGGDGGHGDSRGALMKKKKKEEERAGGGNFEAARVFFHDRLGTSKILRIG